MSGQALQSLCLTLSPSGGCLKLTWWIAIFSASQLLLCMLPDINSLGAVTALGAATTLGEWTGLRRVGRLLFAGCFRQSQLLPLAPTCATALRNKHLPPSHSAGFSVLATVGSALQGEWNAVGGCG